MGTHIWNTKDSWVDIDWSPSAIMILSHVVVLMQYDGLGIKVVKIVFTERYNLQLFYLPFHYKQYADMLFTVS